jgi:hypothetical protein
MGEVFRELDLLPRFREEKCELFVCRLENAEGAVQRNAPSMIWMFFMAVRTYHEWSKCLPGSMSGSGHSRRSPSLRWQECSETRREINSLSLAGACSLSLNQGDRQMDDHHQAFAVKPARRPPWNKGKFVGAKPPLRPSHVWSIRTKLQMQGLTRDLALFNLAIDSKLRGCDVVAVRVDDVAPNGYALDRATVRQKKTGRPVRFELTDQTRLAIDEYLRLTGVKPGELLFPGRRDASRGMTTRQYAPARPRVGGKHRA